MRRKWITPAVVTRFKPYRKIFVVVAAIAVFFSVLIVLENVLFLAANDKQNGLLLLLPYLLSWALVMIACVFGRVAFLLHASGQKSGVVRPHSPSVWSSESRPVSPISMDTLSASYNSQAHLFRHILSVPQSPFCVTEEILRYSDEPPSYEDAVRRTDLPAATMCTQ
ncbi:hypothetical protein RB195_010115 [Necator americanus]|uniref:Uncharacterized protein n=1 Tax=Necator americanus TaxID=51031 RepID=A0ABR1CX66_NECAM